MFNFEDNVTPALIDGAVDVGMGMYNYRANKKMAKTAFDRNLYMSNTAHQREVEDLRLAGLNPVLSVQGNGAATVAAPTGASPNMHRSSSYGAAYNQTKLTKSQVDVNSANAALVNAKAQEQIASNVLSVAKSKYFEGLPMGAKYDVINAMLYPSSNLGQARGLASGILDGSLEVGKKIWNLGQKGTRKIVRKVIDTVKGDDVPTGDDASKSSGISSAKDVKRRKSDYDKGFDRAEMWLKRDKKIRKTGGFF